MGRVRLSPFVVSSCGTEVSTHSGVRRPPGRSGSATDSVLRIRSPTPVTETERRVSQPVPNREFEECHDQSGFRGTETVQSSPIPPLSRVPSRVYLLFRDPPVLPVRGLSGVDPSQVEPEGSRRLRGRCQRQPCALEVVCVEDYFVCDLLPRCVRRVGIRGF